jgi:hypothetical protein
MLQATAAMSVEDAQQWATRWIIEHDITGVRLSTRGQWLHIDPDE